MIKKLRFPLVSILSLVGLFDALYLTVKHMNGEAVRCTVTSGCDEVLSSPYAVIMGMPLPYLGLASYGLMFSLAVLASFGNRAAGTLLLPLAAAMLIFTGWLLYVQAFLLGHFCQYCLISAATTVLISAFILPFAFAANSISGISSDKRTA